MIPIWTGSTKSAELRGAIVEKCVFCSTPTRTWHENTNSPICVNCASTHVINDIIEDNGQRIRAHKRAKTFNRGDSIRAN